MIKWFIFNVGIKYFIVPQWSKLLEIKVRFFFILNNQRLIKYYLIDKKVWQAAAGQMFFSLSVAMGGLIMFSSYNDFRHNIFQLVFKYLIIKCI